MANDLVVQLLLKTGAFSSDLKTAKGQIQNFQKTCDTASKSMTAFGQGFGVNIGMLTKFGGAVGAAVLAGQGLKAVIDSNQTSADLFTEVMSSAKNAVSELAYSIGTFDFSNFADGLEGLIRRGREAAQAIDQLGNTLMSYDVKQAKAQQKIARARAIINDPNSTEEEKNKAKQDLRDAMTELKNASQVLLDDFTNTIVSEVKSRGADISGEGAIDILDKWLEVDATKTREQAKAAAEAGYAEYQKELESLQKDDRYKKDGIVGAGPYARMGRVLDKQNPEYLKELERINKKYREQIAYKVLLEKYSDEELQKLGQQRIQMINTETNLDNLANSMNKIENKNITKTPKTPKTTEIVPVEGSLNYWKKMEQDAISHRDALVQNTDEWKKYNETALKARKIIDDISGKQKELSVQKDSLTYWNNIVSEETKYRDALAMGSDEWNTHNEKIKEALGNIAKINKAMTPDTYKEGSYGFSKEEIEKTMTNISKVLQEGINLSDEQIKGYLSDLTLLQEELDKLNVKFGFKALDTSKNKWEEFNKTMANTSTICSNLAQVFQSSSDSSLSSILNLVSSALPAVGQLISAVSALTAAEAVEAGVGAVGKAVSSSQHWIEAIAAVAALGGVVAAAISSARTAGNFAEGGIVGGSSFTGDRLQANVNSGEMILNRTQQAKLFKQINNGTGGTGEVTFHVSGQELVGVLNNYNRKSKVIR